MIIRTIILSIAFLMSACHQSNKFFEEIPSRKSGIDFNNFLEESADLNVLNYTYFYNGGGVATGDLNNDGLPDIVFTGNMVRNKIFINKGDMRFEDITSSSGIADKQGWCTGVTLVDINNDGWLDIYICRSADVNPERRANLLFVNNKDLTFSEKANEYGLADQGYSTQAAFFDYDRDGDLDVAVINHSLKKYTTGVSNNPELRNEENPFFATKLYRNDGGRFVDVSKIAGITSNVLSFGLGIVVSDFNNDNWPDFFISNDFNEADYLFMNQRDGTFKEQGSSMLSQHSLFSMGTDAADINHDGFSDLVTLDMLPESNFDQKMHSGAENFEKFRYLFSRGFHRQYSRNMLHVNNGFGQFSEVGQLAGISNTDWSWSALLKDFDNDGNSDLFVTNGYVRDYTDMDFIKYSVDHQAELQASGGSSEAMMDYIKTMPGHPMSNYMFRNEGGYSFTNVSHEWGFDRVGVYSGASCADLDGDGDLDLVTSVTNGKAGVFLNQSPKDNGSLRFDLKGEGSNTQGIGAVVKTYAGGLMQHSEHHITRGFQSSIEPILHVGIGKAKKADSVRIIWPDGRTQLLRDVATGKIIQLKQSEATENYNPILPAEKTIYKELDSEGYVMNDRYQNDFSIQATLNNFISNVSPVLAVGDLNRDGKEDLVVGANRLLSTCLKFGTTNGLGKSDSLNDKNSLPVSALALADLDADGYPEIIVGRNAFGRTESSAQTLQLYKNNKGIQFSSQFSFSPGNMGSIGCLAVDTDKSEAVTRVFAGSRIRKEEYPISDTSKLLVLDRTGKFIRYESLPDQGLIGMLTGAQFMDLDGDKKNELVTVGEFSPLKIFVRNGTTWVDETASFAGLPGSGWWCSLVKADLDGDGDEDIVAGNYGLNTQFKVEDQFPISVLSKDFDGNGKSDAITSYFIEGKAYPSHSLDDLLEQLPSLRKRFNTYSSYAKIDMGSLLKSAERENAIEMEATQMQTLILENTGSRKLTIHRLPIQAQFSPVFAMAVADVDLDGKKDLILGGNQSGTRIKYGCYDANVGFVFRNMGGLTFSFIPPSLSGISITGDIRSIAVLESSKKLIMGINGGKVRVFQKQ